VQRRDVGVAHQRLGMRAHEVVVDEREERRGARPAARRPDRRHFAVAEHRVQVAHALARAARVAAARGEQVLADAHLEAQRLEVLHAPLHPGGIEHAAGGDEPHDVALAQPLRLHQGWRGPRPCWRGKRRGRARERGRGGQPA